MKQLNLKESKKILESMGYSLEYHMGWGAYTVYDGREEIITCLDEEELSEHVQAYYMN